MRLRVYFLGVAGLLPFIGLTVATWFGPAEWHAPLIHALAVYAALIISFLGGVHWGVALSRPEHARQHMLLGVAPAMLAWGAVLLPWSILALSAFILLLLLCWWIDRLWFGGIGQRLGYGALRTGLTAVAALSLLAAIGSYGRVGI
ncbi:MAG TPA: DUF3429 domain-containing protein [Halothiobacillus sp.]|nr:MAG: hypothetical protein B7Z82_02060 [Halothiobacillus sp. 20-54-6]HQT42886.1 DUF3429 domain-containing protein [Halothiobacillus sp.]